MVSSNAGNFIWEQDVNTIRVLLGVMKLVSVEAGMADSSAYHSVVLLRNSSVIKGYIDGEHLQGGVLHWHSVLHKIFTVWFDFSVSFNDAFDRFSKNVSYQVVSDLKNC